MNQQTSEARKNRRKPSIQPTLQRGTSRAGWKVVRREVHGWRERAALWDAAEGQQLLDLHRRGGGAWGHDLYH